MDHLRNISKNSIVLFISNLGSNILGYFYVYYAARYLGDAGFGMISFALALVGILGIVGDLGLSTLVIREVAKDKSLTGKYLGNVVGAKIPLSALAFTAIAVATAIMGYIQGYPQEKFIVVYVIALSSIIGSFSALFYSIFQAHEKMEYQSGGQLLNSSLMLIGALLAIYYHAGIIWFAAVYLCSSAVTLIYSFAVCRLKFTMPRIELHASFLRPAMKEALPFALSGMFITIYYMVDSVMLSAMVGDKVVGWYAAAYKLVQFLGFVPAAMFGALFPVTSRLHRSSRDSLRIVFEKSSKYILILAIPMGVGTTLLADKIIFFVYGPGYVPSITALQILVWTQAIIFVNVACGNLLNSINQQVVVTKQTAISACLNVAVNLLLIPRFSYVGAGIATVATEFFALVFLSYAISKSEYRLPKEFAVVILKIVLASAVMAAFIILFRSQALPVLIVAGALVYFIVIFLTNALDASDRRLMRQLINGVRPYGKSG